MQHSQETVRLATFAGGCFWCLEADFTKQPGVLRVVSGYAGGHTPDPTYAEVCTGETGHLEAVQVSYDPRHTTYADLLEVFWRHIDPTDPGGQFVDRGSQYRTAVFYHDEEQHHIAEESKAALERSGRFARPIVTEIKPFFDFYSAEDYHQGYHRTYPVRYRQYRTASGRDRFLGQVWTTAETGPGTSIPQPDDAVLRERLTPIQYAVTRQCGTEPPFRNAYWNEKRAGIYVDIVTGEPLFSSRDKFDSGTGWPSFLRPLEPENIHERTDLSHGMERVEVRSRRGENHLGHVFPDGPEPTGLRYCVNSASLRFIPKEEMEKEGYGEYLKKLNPPTPP